MLQKCHPDEKSIARLPKISRAWIGVNGGVNFVDPRERMQNNRVRLEPFPRSRHR